MTTAQSREPEPVYPVRISENRRYFVDQRGNPVFWLGTTQWMLFRGYTLEEAGFTLRKIRETGFTFAQVMLMGIGDGTQPNVYGEKPWINDNPLTPNEAYFRHVDDVMDLARGENVVISMTLYHQRHRARITVENARAWATWIAQRYRRFPNLVWSLTPEAIPEFIPVIRELAAGLREVDGKSHLVTFKPDPAPYSSSFLHGEEWLDFDSMQTWKWVDLIYPFVTKDYQMTPTKPVLMAEGAYEKGPEYGFDVNPLWIRRQAYYSYLAGAHHTYGHNDSWSVLPTWKQALESPGAAQMGILRNLFEAVPEWWHLVPDQSILLEGGKTDGDILRLAARHKDGKWLIVYLADEAELTVDTGGLAGREKAMAFWLDPKTGGKTAIGTVEGHGPQHYKTPMGWEDALLVVQPV